MGDSGLRTDREQSERCPQTGEIAQAKAQAGQPSRRVVNPDCWELRMRGEVAAMGGVSLWGA